VSIIRSNGTHPTKVFLLLQLVCSHVDNLSGYANRPLPFMLRYLRQRLASHVIILASVVAAVACSVGTQYGVKYLVDGLSAGPARAGGMAGIRFTHVADNSG
jgi:hypothetical protein